MFDTSFLLLFLVRLFFPSLFSTFFSVISRNLYLVHRRLQVDVESKRGNTKKKINGWLKKGLKRLITLMRLLYRQRATWCTSGQTGICVNLSQNLVAYVRNSENDWCNLFFVKRRLLLIHTQKYHYKSISFYQFTIIAFLLRGAQIKDIFHLLFIPVRVSRQLIRHLAKAEKKKGNLCVDTVLCAIICWVIQ